MRAEWLNKDFYGILGVDPASSSEQIKRAYRTRQRSTHPDLHADDPTAEVLTKSLNEANAVLSDPASRKEYDQHLREVAQAVRGDPNQSADPPPPPQPGQDQDAPPWPDHAERGSDFRWTAQTPGTVVALGGLVELGIGYCPHCNGCGQRLSKGPVIDCDACDRTGFMKQSPGISVAVAPGLANGAEIRYPGMGGRSREGGQSGDLYVRYVVVPDSSTPLPPDPGEVGAEPTPRGRPRWAAVSAVGAVVAAVVIFLFATSETGDTPVKGTASSADESSGPTGTPTPVRTPLSVESAQALSDDEAAALLTDLRLQDGAVIAAIPDGSWVPQVSSKCGALTQADWMDDSQRIGFPDGSAEPFPGGLGSQRILAYHLAQAERFDGVVLAQMPDVSGSATAPAVCGDTELWVSLVSSVVEASNWQGVLEWCDQQQLPVDECAARRVNPTGTSDVRLRK